MFIRQLLSKNKNKNEIELLTPEDAQKVSGEDLYKELMKKHDQGIGSAITDSKNRGNLITNAFTIDDENKTITVKDTDKELEFLPLWILMKAFKDGTGFNKNYKKALRCAAVIFNQCPALRTNQHLLNELSTLIPSPRARLGLQNDVIKQLTAQINDRIRGAAQPSSTVVDSTARQPAEHKSKSQSSIQSQSSIFSSPSLSSNLGHEHKSPSQTGTIHDLQTPQTSSFFTAQSSTESSVNKLDLTAASQMQSPAPTDTSRNQQTQKTDETPSLTADNSNDDHPAKKLVFSPRRPLNDQSPSHSQIGSLEENKNENPLPPLEPSLPANGSLSVNYEEDASPNSFPHLLKPVVDSDSEQIKTSKNVVLALKDSLETIMIQLRTSKKVSMFKQMLKGATLEQLTALLILMAEVQAIERDESGGKYTELDNVSRAEYKKNLEDIQKIFKPIRTGFYLMRITGNFLRWLGVKTSLGQNTLAWQEIFSAAKAQTREKLYTTCQSNENEYLEKVKNEPDSLTRFTREQEIKDKCKHIEGTTMKWKLAKKDYDSFKNLFGIRSAATSFGSLFYSKTPNLKAFERDFISVPVLKA